MKNDMKETALHIAATRGHAHVVKALVAEGAEVTSSLPLSLFMPIRLSIHLSVCWSA
jgi:hypothetical protein